MRFNRKSFNGWSAVLATVLTAACAAESGTIVSGEREQGVLLVGSRPVIEYLRVGQDRVFEGDIALSPAQLGPIELARGVPVREGEDLRGDRTAYLAARTDSLWPGGVVPYAIDPSLAPWIVEKVHVALQHWQLWTGIRFVERTDERDFVTFRPSDAGFAYANIGRIGGQQFVNLVDRNPTGVVVHELGHTLGLWHEHTRPDRDDHVAIHYENIVPGQEGNFGTYVSGAMMGPYDLMSIMHYPAYEFSANGLPTITNLYGGTYLTNYDHLSVGDMAAISQLYGLPRGPADDGSLVVDSASDLNDPLRVRVEVGESWEPSTLAPGYYGSGYWVGRPDGGDDVVSFWFHLQYEGTYTLDAWWAQGDDRSTAAVFTVINPDGWQIGSVLMNQQTGGAQWNELGTWYLPAGWNRVEVSRWGLDPGEVVVADAIRVRL